MKRRHCSDICEDMARVDYSAIYRECIDISPSMKEIIAHIQEVTPPRRGEYVELLDSIVGKDESSKKSAERLYEMSLRAVLNTALREHNIHGVDLADAFQEGCIGLQEAIGKYHKDIRSKFSSYSSWWILRRMWRDLPYYQPNMRFPDAPQVNVVKSVGKLGHPITEYTDPNEIRETLVSDVGENESNADMMAYEIIPPLSLETMEENGGGIPDNSQEEILRSCFRRDFIEKKLFPVLTEMEQDVITLRFGLGPDKEEWTLERIGQKYGVTRERIRQRQVKAIQKMRKACYDIGIFQYCDIN